MKIEHTRGSKIVYKQRLTLVPLRMNVFKSKRRKLNALNVVKRAPSPAKVNSTLCGIEARPSLTKSILDRMRYDRYFQ